MVAGRTSSRLELADAWAGASPKELELEGLAELARRSYYEFFKQSWPVFHPGGDPLHDYWYIGAICEHAQAVSAAQISRLRIHIPPGFGKSLTISVDWPGWEWLERPHLSYIATSANPDVVKRDAIRHQKLVNSRWYQESFQPEWTWDEAQNAKGFFMNTAGGARMSRSTGQAITGLRAPRIIIDDPLDSSKAYADKAAIEEHIRYYEDTLSERLQKGPISAIILVMQRLHEADLAGFLEEQDDKLEIETGEREWVTLCLPNEYDGRPSTTYIVLDGEKRFFWEDPRTEEGELLCEQLMSREETDRLKRKNRRKYETQYQQKPAPEGGTIFKRDWFRRKWTEGKLPEFDLVFSSWDTAFKTTKDADFCAGQVWGVENYGNGWTEEMPEGDWERYYLLDQNRRKMELPELVEAIKRQLQEHPLIAAVVIELKSNGKRVIERLEEEFPMVVGYNPQSESKQERAQAIVLEAQRGQIIIPHADWFPWIRQWWLPEITRFPHARKDDQVDAMTQAILWARDEAPKIPWIFAMG